MTICRTPFRTAEVALDIDLEILDCIDEKARVALLPIEDIDVDMDDLIELKADRTALWMDLVCELIVFDTDRHADVVLELTPDQDPEIVFLTPSKADPASPFTLFQVPEREPFIPSQIEEVVDFACSHFSEIEFLMLSNVLAPVLFKFSQVDDSEPFTPSQIDAVVDFTLFHFSEIEFLIFSNADPQVAFKF
ncbi:hypothetical protein, partial [uncultured Dubosiella sp.]|uniref:hypothetical protein n=1 Tax=uncultured Dubosiella sp. TaxID=1937011 RepID=UPI0025B32702